MSERACATTRRLADAGGEHLLGRWRDSARRLTLHLAVVAVLPPGAALHVLSFRTCEPYLQRVSQP